MALVLAGILLAAGLAQAQPQAWVREWPDTDFSKSSVDFAEILSGGPPKDGIPSIDNPRFRPAAEVDDLDAQEPVIGLMIAGDARAYPLRILTWHEIVNDVVGGVPVAVTYCPLCNAAIVFEREVEGRVLEFGTTGKLRHSDLVMYDRETESWWQQFTGEAIVGALTGTSLTMVPARLESWERFKARAPEGQVLVPRSERFRDYGVNPYVGYDTARAPFLYRGPLPEGIEPMIRVVVVDGEAWSLPLLRERGTIQQGDLTLSWVPGQRSALDTRIIAEGRDVGNVVVQRGSGDAARDVVHDVTFAFVFHAFHPDGVIHTR
ncbi:MAG: DUF3179 domain-containing protein [Rhodospirillales bacterium]|nr:MAG: DUF3179 domain-containing protein [Rhodospirillales bacterium]